ncbi:MAG: hypothetical protein MI824_23960 [Hyphomicrobiales bacterium]|nr:hypothetical protein [Hyphomicrobiales bacterium]
MTKTAFSVYLYGLYLMTAIGVPFVVMPHFALGLFGMTAGDEMWVRLAGVLSAVMGGFYVMAVHTDLTRFYGWTVPARLVSGAFLYVMAALGHVGPAIVVFATLDTVSAGLTWLALRFEPEAAPASG